MKAFLVKHVPQVPEQSKDELTNLDELTKKKQELEEKIGHDAEQLNVLETIETKYEVLKEDLRTFNEEIR